MQVHIGHDRFPQVLTKHFHSFQNGWSRESRQRLLHRLIGWETFGDCRINDGIPVTAVPVAILTDALARAALRAQSLESDTESNRNLSSIRIPT